MWRNTALVPKLFGINAAALPFFAIFAMHWSWGTFWVSVVATIGFTVVSAFGYTPIACIRLARRKLGGKARTRDATVEIRRFHREG